MFLEPPKPQICSHSEWKSEEGQLRPLKGPCKLNGRSERYGKGVSLLETCTPVATSIGTEKGLFFTLLTRFKGAGNGYSSLF